MKKVKQLLLVEDDQVGAYLAQLAMEEAGIAEDIVICGNGQEALEYLKKGLSPKPDQHIHFPELIFLDLNMPVMDGYEFLQEFMEIEELKGKNIHVIILSSASFKKEQARIEALPASGYIEKPLNIDKLAEVLSPLY